MKKIISIVVVLGYSLVSALPSCNNPQKITSDTVIILTEDIIITDKGSPFVMTESFGNTTEEKLIITSNTGNRIVINEKATWDLSSLTTKNKVIEFAGNAQLICRPGSTLSGHGGVLRFTDSSRFIIDKGTQQ